MSDIRARARPGLLALAFVAAMGGGGAGPARAVDTEPKTGAPDLAAVRDSIKAKDFASALTVLNKLVNDGVQHADVYNLLGFSLRKLGDFKTSYTYYQKALDYDPDHKSAHEYIGELYLETNRPEKAREHHAILVKLCPSGCEEREDLEQAMGKAGVALSGN